MQRAVERVEVLQGESGCRGMEGVKGDGERCRPWRGISM